MKRILWLCCVLLFAFAGCQNKVEQVQVGQLNDYKDPAYGFKIKYPKDWKQLGTAGKAVFAKSQEVVDKIQVDPKTGEEGAIVTVKVIPYEKKTPDAIVITSKDEMKQTWANIEMQPDEQVTVGSKQATKVSYSIHVTSKTSITGYQIFVPGDTALYNLDFVGYGDQYNAHALVFDSMRTSFELPVVMAKKSDTWQASSNLEKYNSDFFTVEYPDNLNFVQQNKGDKDLVMEMRADRQDCSIHIDVFGANKWTVEKIWAQNKGKYKAKNTGEATIDGNKAPWVEYSPPIKDINSRAYFLVKNDKVIRITVNWYAPQKDIYFTAFEKCINSLKLK